MRETDEFLSMLDTFEGAQQAVTTALGDVHSRRLEVEGRERTPVDYEEAQNRLRASLGNLPPDVSCVSVAIKCPRLKGEPRTNVEYILRQLQHAIDYLDPTQELHDEINFEFVVRPNYIPEELWGLSHGSRVRELAGEVSETLVIDYFNETHVLSIKPHGAPGGMAGIWAMRALPIKVPLKYVTAIQLHKEKQLLTPWIKCINDPNAEFGVVFEKKPVEYD